MLCLPRLTSLRLTASGGTLPVHPRRNKGPQALGRRRRGCRGMATPGRHCALAYPDRFYAAFAFAQDVPDGAAATSNEARLLLYALYQQVWF